MLKPIFFLIIIIISAIVGCNSEMESEKISNQIEKQVTAKPLPKFISLREMLADASDFHEEDGSLKFISEDGAKLHVQVSKPILETDLESVKEEIVKRDIVYVAFQTFAKTDIDELSITAVPNDIENPKKYYEKYKRTIKVNRSKAKLILQKYIGSDDFSMLYKNDGQFWYPNENFSKLRFEKLEEVFGELSQK